MIEKQYNKEESTIITGSWMNPDYIPELVSVIIPTYNRANLLAETLASVFAQTYRPIEILVIDDGSTDNTEEVAKNYLSKCDDKLTLYYIKQDHAGAQTARTIGCPKSYGEYIQYLDSDDFLSENKIRNQVNALENNPDFDIAYGPWRCLYTNDMNLNSQGPVYQKTGMASDDSMLHGYLSGTWYCPIHCYLFRRSLVEKAGPWDAILTGRQDTDYLVQCLLFKPKAIYVPDSLVFYRRHQSDHIGSPKNFLKYFAATLRNMEKWSNQLKDQKNLYREDLSQALYNLADTAISMDYPEGPALCYDMMMKITGSAESDLLRPGIKRKCKILTRIYLARPIRKIFGEGNIIWLDSAFRSLLRLQK